MNISRRKNRPPGFLFTAPVLNLPATIMLLPKPKVLQETHMVVLLAVACRQIFVSRFQAGAIQYPGFSLKIDYE